jgi:citrate/tricarballylate utilization protein
MSALGSTTVAFIYQDLLHLLPPYRLFSVPVVLGSIGGIAMMIGVAGLISIKLKSNPQPSAQQATRMDYAFLVTLGVVALSGMLTLAFRETKALGTMLILHLALVAALFITAPYGKFVHMVYRCLALVRYHLEEASFVKGGHS